MKKQKLQNIVYQGDGLYAVTTQTTIDTSDEHRVETTTASVAFDGLLPIIKRFGLVEYQLDMHLENQYSHDRRIATLKEQLGDAEKARVSASNNIVQMCIAGGEVEVE